MYPTIDVSKPNPARMYDYFLGGKDNFAIDRQTAEKALQSAPTIRTGARENRAFLGRAVRYLVAEAGIRQFLDIGTGLPSVNNVHEVAQSVAPESRVVYVDNDPVVLAHARALLASAPAGRTTYISADLREPEKILADPVVGRTLDFARPVALMLVGILHFLPDSEHPGLAVQTLLAALPPGSFLVASHSSAEYSSPAVETGALNAYRNAGVSFQFRAADEFAQLAFTGLEMVDPGVVLVSEWRPEERGPRPLAPEVGWHGAVGRTL